MTDQLPRLINPTNPQGPSNRRERAIYEKASDSILSRLRNPDEAMNRAIDRLSIRTNVAICRALADVLAATPPEATEE